jgi:predicted restriction endonuclease
MRRAIIARDRHCQFPGCDASRHVDVHHIRHWADGGETSVENGVTVCAHHHRLLHEHGYRVERTNTDPGGRKLRTITVVNTGGRKIELSAGLRRFRFLKKNGSSVY